MIRVVSSPVSRRPFKMLAFFVPLLAMQLAWAAPAHAVCEELMFNMFTKYFKLGDASKSCRKFIEKNVRAHAFAATLVEVCMKKKNYSSRYRTRVYKVASRCVDRRSARWLVSKYNTTRSEQLKALRQNLEITNNGYCRQKNVTNYMKMAVKALSKTLSDAKSHCD